jgi:hypothetical protein
MFRRFNERQRDWANYLSQIARIFLPLSFDVFLGLLVICLCIYKEWYYLFLGILLGIYWTRKYRFPQLKWIICFSLLFMGVILFVVPFQKEIKGEVREVLYDGIIVGNTFIYTSSED